MTIALCCIRPTIFEFIFGDRDLMCKASLIDFLIFFTFSVGGRDAECYAIEVPSQNILICGP